MGPINTRLEFSAWLHDCHHNPYLGSPDRANIFYEMVKPDICTTHDAALVNDVIYDIISTSKHIQTLNHEENSARRLLMDLYVMNFAIKEDFRSRSISSANEYYKIPADTYIQKRKELFKTRLEKGRIYCLLSDELEATARANITESLRQNHSN